MKDIFIVCPGTRRALMQSCAALSISKNNILITGSLISRYSVLYKLLKLFRINKKIEKRVVDLPIKNLRSFYILGILFYLARKINNRYVTNISWYLRNRVFSLYAIITICLYRFNKKGKFVVYGYSSSCGETSYFFKYLRVIFKNKVILVLEMSSSTQNYERKLLSYEKEKWDLSDDIFQMPYFLSRDEIIEIEHADKIVVSSLFVKKNLEIEFALENHQDKFFYIQKPVSIDDNECSDICNKFKEFSILYVGNVSLLKGYLYLLEALDQFYDAKIKLHVAGKILLPDYIIDRGYITYYGYLNKKKLAELYTLCHVLVHPSLSESNPNAIIEALNFCLPVIASKPCEDSISDKFNGFVVSTQSSNEIYECIKFLYDDRSKLKQLEYNCKRKMFKYSFKNYIQDFSNFLESI